MLVAGGRRKILGLDSDWISERYPKTLQREPREIPTQPASTGLVLSLRTF